VSSQDYTPVPFPYYAEPHPAHVESYPTERVRERYWLYCLLFSLTMLTATMVGAAMQIDFDRNLPFNIENSFPLYAQAWKHPAILLRGLPFSCTMLLILLAHEFGHYLAAVYHRVDASLPYFLPSPVMGTFGAFIRVRSPIFTKHALFDIGIAGPLAGFVFLVPTLAIGLAFSKVIPGIGRQGEMEFGVPLLQNLLTQAIFPGVRAMDICLHPMARAAWVGMLATALNLLPIGQLDGGHILYSFFPRQHRLVSRVICLILIPLGLMDYLGVPSRYVWHAWTAWGLVLLWLGRRHPVVHDDTLLSPGRRQLGLLALLVFLLCFTLVPIREGGL
jgi:membrane-associated protease RseP (regulator of RpoE activity)